MDSLQLTLLDSTATERERLTIKESLLSAMRCLGDPWQLVSADGDLWCIWIASRADLASLEMMEELCPIDRLVVLSAIKIESPAKWQLLLADNQTHPTVVSLIQLLSRIQAHFFPKHSATLRRFDPAQSVIKLLQMALTDGIARLYSFAELPQLYVLPKENTVYISGDIEKLIPLILSPREKITVQEIADQELLEQVGYAKFSSHLSDYAAFFEGDLFQEAHVTTYTRYSFGELIWFATLIASQGRLLMDAADNETLFLAKVPEFMSLHYPELLADFSALAQSTLAERLATKTVQSQYEIINFYNACLMLPGAQRLSSVAEQQQVYSFADLALTLKNQAKQLAESMIVIVAGAVSAGKSTVCATLGDSSQVLKGTDSANNLTVEPGEIGFGDNSSLFFYEIARQDKFDTSTQVLCQNAWGLLVLIDNSGIAPFSELDYYAQLYKAYFNNAHIAIGITHTDLVASPSISDYQAYLTNFLHCNCPVLAVDPRQLSDSIALIIALLTHQPKTNP